MKTLDKRNIVAIATLFHLIRRPAGIKNTSVNKMDEDSNQKLPDHVARQLKGLMKRALKDGESISTLGSQL